MIILSPVLWISGRVLAGKGKARFLDAVWKAILGTVIADVLGIFIVGIIATLIGVVHLDCFDKALFDCGWLKVIVIGVIAILMLIAIIIILAAIGVAILTLI